MENKENKRESYSFLEWNINARGGVADYEIPMWITNYFNDSDIIVLTEFKSGKNWDVFKAEMEKPEKNPYNIIVSPYCSDARNQVFIALRKDKFIIDAVQCADIYDKDQPEILTVDVRVGKAKTPMSIIGTRIKTQDKHCKPKQYSYMDNVIKKKEKCLCLGDFNCTNSYLNRNISEKNIVYGPRTYRGLYYSFVFKNSYKRGLDWIIAKNIKVFNNQNDCKESPYATYNWDFISQDNGYREEKDQYHDVQGIPDHGILMGGFEIKA